MFCMSLPLHAHEINSGHTVKSIDERTSCLMALVGIRRHSRLAFAEMLSGYGMPQPCLWKATITGSESVLLVKVLPSESKSALVCVILERIEFLDREALDDGYVALHEDT